ncbi:MAG: CPBP family intramembrane metalloprotease [Thermomicrobiales bacterium]
MSATNPSTPRDTTTGEEQYTRTTIFAIWLAATLPMGILAWIVWPTTKDHVSLDPGVFFWLLMIAGMIWQCILSLVILKRELGTLAWSTLAPRIWAQHPRDPKTGMRNPKLWWHLIPIAIVFAGLTMLESELLDPLSGAIGLHAPKGTNIQDLVSDRFIGDWWLMAIALVSCAFNYVLGEELLFRGVLLPRMRGAFGRWDWLANNTLFTAYHVHLFWGLPGIFLTSLPFSWAARRYRTFWFSVVLHGIEGIVLLVVVLGVITGKAT